MGYNTTVFISNDALSDIESDGGFGRRLGDAVRRAFVAGGHPVEVSAGSFVNAAYVLGSHHSSRVIPYLIGGNFGWRVEGITLDTTPEGMEERLLRQLAQKHGFRLVRKKKA